MITCTCGETFDDRVNAEDHVKDVHAYVDLNSKEYRDAFVAAHVRNGIAFQLRAMRDRREWDQKKVASLMGNEKLQPVISRYENPDYGRMSVSTLIDLANAYDVGLIVTFAPFSEMVERDDALPQQSLDVEGYQEEKDRLAKDSRAASLTPRKRRNTLGNEIQLINPKTIGSDLEKFIPQMERALPRHMTADRMARIALTSLRVNPKLMDCTRDSFYGSLMAASQLGLEPGINGQCYLIPYGKVCTLVPGWRGYMDLLNRTEEASAWTEAVYEGDEFEYSLGTNPEIHHKRGKWTGKEPVLQYVYAVGRIKNSEFPIIDVWDIEKVWAHRNKQNKVGDRHYSYAHPEMYARKIPLLQVIKYLPSSIELANASALDVSATEGRQSLTIDMALKGDLENGADAGTPSSVDELDALFEKLSVNPAQQREMRESYAGRTHELVDYLKKKLPPEEVRRRGRPTKEQVAARQAAEAAKAEPQPTIGDIAEELEPIAQDEPGAFADVFDAGE